jgi:hypothetical protein
MNAKPFSPALGIPMHLLSERALNEAFLATLEEHRRAGRPMVIDRKGQVAVVPAGGLVEEARYAHQRIAELDARIHAIEHRSSLNETPNC